MALYISSQSSLLSCTVMRTLNARQAACSVTVFSATRRNTRVVNPLNLYKAQQHAFNTFSKATRAGRYTRARMYMNNTPLRQTNRSCSGLNTASRLSVDTLSGENAEPHVSGEGSVDRAHAQSSIHPGMKRIVDQITRLNDTELVNSSWHRLLACRGEILGFKPVHSSTPKPKDKLAKKTSLDTNTVTDHTTTSNNHTAQVSAEEHPPLHRSEPLEPALVYLSKHTRFKQHTRRDLFLRSLLQTPTGGMQAKLTYLQLTLIRMPVVPSETTVSVLAGEVNNNASAYQITQLIDFLEKGSIPIEQQIVFGILSATSQRRDHTQLAILMQALQKSRAIREAPEWTGAYDTLITNKVIQLAQIQAQLRGSLYTMYAQTIYAKFAHEYHLRGEHARVTEMVGSLLESGLALGPRLATAYITSVMHDHSYLKARSLMRWSFERGLELKSVGDTKGCINVGDHAFWDVEQRKATDRVATYGYAWLDNTPGLAPAKTRVVGFELPLTDDGESDSDSSLRHALEGTDHPPEPIYIGFQDKPKPNRAEVAKQGNSEWDLLEYGIGRKMESMPPLSMSMIDAFLTAAVHLPHTPVRVPWDILSSAKVLGLKPTCHTYTECSVLAGKNGTLAELEALRSHIDLEISSGNTSIASARHNLELMMRLKFVVSAGMNKHYIPVQHVMADVCCMDAESVKQAFLLADGLVSPRLKEAAQGELLLAVLESCSRAGDTRGFEWTASMYKELIPTNFYTEGYFVKLLNNLRYQQTATVAEIAAIAKDCRKLVPNHGAHFYGAFMTTLGSVVQPADVSDVLLDVLKLYENKIKLSRKSSKGKGDPLPLESGPYDVAVHMCAVHNVAHSSWDFVERMREKQIKISSFTINPILEQYMKAGEYHDVCEKFCFAIERYRVYPTSKSVDLALDAAVKARSLSDLLAVDNSASKARRGRVDQFRMNLVSLFQENEDMHLTTLEFVKLRKYIDTWKGDDVAIPLVVHTKCLAALTRDPVGAYKLGQVHYFEYLLGIVENLRTTSPESIDPPFQELLTASLLTDSQDITNMYSYILHDCGLKGKLHKDSPAVFQVIIGPDSAFGKKIALAAKESNFGQLSDVLRARKKTEEGLIEQLRGG